MQKIHQKTTNDYLGKHVIAEFFGCVNLENHGFVKKTLKNSAAICKATALHSKFHQFTPQGLTGFILLSESHISIHTWPEFKYAAVDVFTCGHKTQPEKAIQYLKEQFGASRVQISVIIRGEKKFLIASQNGCL